MPVWAGMPASPVNTFIKNYGVADKIDAVFTFSGGGDNDRCLAQLSKSLKNIKSQVALADPIVMLQRIIRRSLKSLL